MLGSVETVDARHGVEAVASLRASNPMFELLSRDAHRVRAAYVKAVRNRNMSGFHFVGKVTPPADMIDAARKSLTPENFDKLMLETGGKPPTPDQLVAAAEAERNVTGIQRPTS